MSFMSDGQYASLEWKHFLRHQSAYESCSTLPGVDIYFIAVVVILRLCAQILKHMADELSITGWADLVDKLYERWPICLPGVETFL